MSLFNYLLTPRLYKVYRDGPVQVIQYLQYIPISLCVHWFNQPKMYFWFFVILPLVISSQFDDNIDIIC